MDKNKKEINPLLLVDRLPVLEDALDDIANTIKSDMMVMGQKNAELFGVSQVLMNAVEKEMENEEKEESEIDEEEARKEMINKKVKPQLPPFDENDFFKHDFARVLDV